MPKFVCKSCGQVFNSKEGLRDHVEEEHGGKRVIDDSSGFDFDLSPKKVLGHLRATFKNKKKRYTLVALFGAALLIGSSFFGSFSGLGSGNRGYNASADTNPPTGYGLQRRPSVELPDRISKEPLEAKEQLAVLLQGGDGEKPAVLLQYSCANCPSLVRNLTQITRDFEPWVYLAPYPDMEDKLALSAWRNLETMDNYNQTEIKQFICANLNDRPVSCAF